MPDFDYELRAAIPRVLVEVVPGEPLAFTVSMIDDDNAPVPVVDASSWEVLAQLRTQASAATVLHTFTTDSPINAEVTAGTPGYVTLTATAAETAAWQAAWTNSPQQAVSDLLVVDATGAQHSVADLVFTLLPRVTREA
jgi:hypothetical protein